MLEKLAKNKQKPISFDVGEKLAKELKAVKYVECSALTQVGTAEYSNLKVGKSRAQLLLLSQKHPII